MLILTTIYFADLKEVPDEARKSAFPLEPGTPESLELCRQLMSLYEGKNRVLPVDRNS